MEKQSRGKYFFCEGQRVIILNLTLGLKVSNMEIILSVVWKIVSGFLFLIIGLGFVAYTFSFLLWLFTGCKCNENETDLD